MTVDSYSYSSGQLTITGWKSNCLLREDSASLHDVIDALTDVAVAIIAGKQSLPTLPGLTWEREYENTEAPPLIETGARSEFKVYVVKNIATTRAVKL